MKPDHLDRASRMFRLGGAAAGLVCAALITSCGRAADTDSTVANTTAAAPSANLQTTATQPAAKAQPQASLTAGVAHCAPPDGGAPWVETGRVADQNRTYVMLAHRDDPTWLEGALVLLAEGGCQSEVLGHDASAAVGSGMPRLDDAAYARLVDQDFQWRVDRSGGVAELARALVEGDSDHIQECGPGEYAGCVPTWFAVRMRARGVRVDPPSS